MSLSLILKKSPSTLAKIRKGKSFWMTLHTTVKNVMMRTTLATLDTAMRDQSLSITPTRSLLVLRTKRNMATYTRKKSVTRNKGKVTIKKTVTVTTSIKRRKK